MRMLRREAELPQPPARGRPRAAGHNAGFGLTGRFAELDEGLDAGRAIVAPGLMNKATAQAHHFFPRSWVRRIAGTIKL